MVGMRRLIWGAVLAASSALGPALALAAEHGAEARGGMPQLRFNEPILVGQVVWLLVIFGLLYYIMARYALPGVASVLADRQARIAADLEAARAARDAGDAALAEHRAATAQARAEAQAGINAALATAQDAAEAKSAELSARLNAQIDAAEAQIGAARDAAMAALRQVATETTGALVTRLIGHADPAAIATAVGHELSARGHA
jgi:F-type H+-transporting ATPase subunit b